MKRSKLKRYFTLKLSLISFLLTLIKNTYNCPQYCTACKDSNICERCEYGFGIVEGQCHRCSVKDCKYCDGNIDSCETCAIFHYKEESKDFKGNFECKNCGFGCMECLNEDKCLTCGKMFRFSKDKPDECIADHRTLFFIMAIILVFLLVTITLAFYCTNMTPEQERELIKKYLEEKGLIEKDEEIKEEEEKDPDVRRLESNMDIENPRKRILKEKKEDKLKKDKSDEINRSNVMKKFWVD